MKALHRPGQSRFTRRRIRGVAMAMFVAVTTACVGTGLAATSRSHAAKPAPQWHRVFFDNFSHGLQPSLWGLYSGQPAGDPGGWWSPTHAVVANGVLNLETYRDAQFGGRWVSAGVSLGPGLKQTYGKYVVRMRMDRGTGVGIAVLLWPVSDRWPPEIDFAENGGATEARDTLAATLHYGVHDTTIQRTLSVNVTRWHNMGVEWMPGEVVYTVDGATWAVVRSRGVPAQPMVLDIQTAAGSCGQGWAPCPDQTTPAEVDAQIGWVAAYAYPAAKRPSPAGSSS